MSQQKNVDKVRTKCGQLSSLSVESLEASEWLRNCPPFMAMFKRIESPNVDFSLIARSLAPDQQGALTEMLVTLLHAEFANSRRDSYSSGVDGI